MPAVVLLARLITEEIREVRQRSVITADGTER
jgi:hypothetical protein